MKSSFLTIAGMVGRHQIKQKEENGFVHFFPIFYLYCILNTVYVLLPLVNFYCICRWWFLYGSAYIVKTVSLFEVL